MIKYLLHSHEKTRPLPTLPPARDEGYISAEAAPIIRRDVFSHEQAIFNGHFKNKCQKLSPPKSLQTLVTMILRGHAENKTSNPCFKQAMFTLSQLVNLYMTKTTGKDFSSAFHTKSREPHTGIYTEQ